MYLTLKEIMTLQEGFDKEHSGQLPFYVHIDENNLADLEHLVVCLMGELGEFSNILKKVRRGDFPLNQAKSDLDMELVDTFIYLIKIANQFGVDIEGIYKAKLEKNQQRFESLKK